MIDLPYQWIRTNEALVEVAKIWSSAPAIALDTEFVRTETFYARLGLIQVGLDDQVWLIEPLTIDQWAPFTAILENPNIVKVLHSLSEDAEVLKYQLNADLVGAFDTQIAAGFLGRPIQVSYAKLVEELFEVTLEKEATRSDWTQRPLSDTQCRYAAADVYWLFRAYQSLAKTLTHSGRIDWVFEDSAWMVANTQPVPVEDYYLKLRGGWKLRSQHLLALKYLCTWRERLARSENLNRGRILQDKELISIAERMPNNKAWLQKQLKLPSRKIRLYGDAILQNVCRAEEARRTDWPPRIPGPLPADQADLMKRVRAALSLIAEEHGLPVELLARRKLVEEWVRSGCRDGQYQLPDAFHGWRRALFVDQVQPMLNKQWESINEA